MFWLRRSTPSQPTTSTALRVFISYSRKDMKTADRIVDALKEKGIDVRIDRRDLPIAVEWQDELADMIRQSETVLWLVSKHSVNSEWCLWELATLTKLNKRLVPLQVGAMKPEDLPEVIRRKNIAPFLEAERFDAQIEKLVDALLVPIAWVKQQRRLDDQASKPGNRLRGRDLIEAEQWLRDQPGFAAPPSEAIRTFIAKSRVIADRNKNLLMCSLVLGIVLVAGSAWYVGVQWRVAQIAESKSLAVASSRTTEQGDAASGLLLALKGMPQKKGFLARPIIAYSQSSIYRSLFSLRESRVFEGHEAPLTYAETSPDGRLVLTSSEDGSARLWPVKEIHPDVDPAFVTLNTRSQPAGFRVQPVKMATFSPDSSRIVTISKDQAGLLWRSDGRRLARLERHTGEVLFAGFSDDSRYVVTTGADHTARLWSAAYGWHLRDFEGHRGNVVAADFSPDGSLLATASVDRTALIWPVEDDDRPILLEGHGDRVLSVAFDSTGAFVATASRDDKAIIWTLDGALHKRLIGHEGDVNRVRFAPHAPLAITASDDNTAKLWNTETGAEISTLSGHRSRVIDADFSRDGSRILTASVDGAIGLWRLQENGVSHQVEQIAVLRGHERDIVSAQFSADGAWIISASKDHTARLWHATEGQGFADSLSHPGDVRTFAFSSDGKRIVTAVKRGLVRIWDAETHEILNEDDVADGRDLTDEEQQSKQIISVAFSTDGSLIALAHEGGAVSLHRPDGKRLEQVGEDLIGHEQRVRSVDFSSDDTRLVTSSADGKVKVWDVQAGRVLVTPCCHEGRVRSAVFSPDDRQILTVSQDRTVKLWESANGEHLDTLNVHEDDVWAAGFSPDGSMIVTGSEDGQAFITELAEDGRSRPLFGQSRQLAGHGDNIRSAEFSRDGRYVLTSSWDRSVRLWDAKTAEELAVIPSEDIVLDAAFDPSGRRVAHLMKNLVRFRPIYPTVEELIAAAKEKAPRQRTREERQIDAMDLAPPGGFDRLGGLISTVWGEE